MNFIGIFNTIWDGIRGLGALLWRVLLIPSPFAPVMMFYHVAPILIVYLYTTSPATAAGMDRLGALIGVPWWVAPFVFVACAMIGYENRTPRMNALLTLPMAFYAVLLLAGFFNGNFPVSALIPALYMLVAAWSSLVMIRYYQELQTVKMALRALELKVAGKL